jgi:5-carboxymethyl-2-hydroxymuconate isomerase
MQIPATAGSQVTTEIIIAVIGALLVAIQSLTLFILGDIRARIQRLETLRMGDSQP